MRWIARVCIIASVLLIVVLLLLKNHLEDIWSHWDQYNVSAYVHASVRNSFHHDTLEYHAPSDVKAGDKIIIMAKLEKEDTEWVAANLPECVPFRDRARILPSCHMLTSLLWSQVAAGNLHCQPNFAHTSLYSDEQRS